MKDPLKSEAAAGLGLLLARVPLGFVLVLAGYRKLVDPGLGSWVRANLSRVPGSMPGWFGNVYLHSVPFAEILCGALLVVGLLTRLSAFIVTLMLVSFTIAVTGFISHDKGGLFTPNVFYLCLALVTFLVGPGRFSLDAWIWGKDKTPAS